jgi:hypothetical protein
LGDQLGEVGQRAGQAIASGNFVRRVSAYSHFLFFLAHMRATTLAVSLRASATEEQS